MTMATRWLTAGSIVLALAFTQQALAETTDRRCAKGADVRRIEIRFADDSGRLPCKVIYRPEVESDTLGIISWQNIPDLAACKAQADEVIKRLTIEDWICTEDQEASDGEVGNIARLFEQDAAADANPSELDAKKTPGGDDANLVRGTDEPARLIDNPDIAPPSADLASLIKGDLNQLDITLDGALEAEIAGYGDLNADDIDDALVLYTYTSPQPAYRQFIAIYMSDGETYQLTATKPVSGTISATMGARIVAIDRGVIHLFLEAFEPGDPSCCPSGTQHQTLALRELDLVEIDVDAPTR
ncbi:MAG: hypothetical protein ACR2RF_08385 [Geminicoccaceae bacterium]